MATNDRHGDTTNGRNGEFLLQIADAAGARPRPTINGRYTGYCPFHGDPTTAVSRDLSIDIRQGRFNCSKCRISDFAPGFAARVWRMTRRDAQKMIESGAEPTVKRPLHDGDSSFPQNTALLTRAMLHYRDNLEYSQEAVWYLATLGLKMEQAAKLGLGWCPPQAAADTMEALRRDGITEQELQNSNLFDHRDREALAGCIILPDRDSSGGTTWMAGIIPDGPEAGQPWPQRPTAPRTLRGWKPYLLGLYTHAVRPNRLYVTDDYRLAIRLMAAERYTACTMGRTDPPTAARMCANSRPREIAILYNGQSTGRQVANALTQEHNITRSNVLLGNPAVVREIINDRTINLPEILQEKEATSKTSEPRRNEQANQRNRRDSRRRERSQK